MNHQQLPEPVQHAHVIPAPVPGMPLQPVQLPDGRWVYASVPQPQHVVVQLPEQSTMSPAQREFMLNVVLLLVVAVVLCGCIAGVVVVCGGTLMGLIGAVGANAVPIGLTAVGVLLAVGWVASKLKATTKERK